MIAIPVVIRRLAKETTGIKANSQELKANSKYYNLQGLQVENPGKGLYIKDGKKVIVR